MLGHLVRITKLAFVFAAAVAVSAPAESLAVEYKAAAPPDRAADVVFVAGNVYTVDACRSWAQAVAIKDGKITYVGDDEGAILYIGAKTKIQDLNGRLLLPGFHDSHVHLVDGGVALSDCTVDDLPTKEAVFERIAQYCKEHKDDAWIRGSGWPLPFFPETGPTKEELDRIIPDRPALFYSQDYHSVWLNSKALQAAGIKKSSVNPPHGIIERDSATGEPSGTLREDAIDLVNKVLPKQTDKQRSDGLLRAIKLANRFGITSVQDAHADADVLNAYLDLQRRNQLTLKVVAALGTDPERGPEQIAQMMRMREKFSQGRLKATTAKIFADGVIESHTASLIEPYTDRPGYKGLPNFTKEKLADLVSALSLARFQIHVHAIGDQAVRDTLDAFEAAHASDRDLRHEIAHLELIDQADVQRFRKLGVIANCQALWAFNDPYVVKCTLPLIGADRAKNLYKFQSLYRSGAIMAGGSDWNVSSMNPLDAMQVAITRMGLENEGGEPLLPDEKMALPDVVAMYTINGAFANHQERENGSIEVGKAADMIVLDKNIFTIAPSEVHNAKVVLTLLDGGEVFRDESFPQQDFASANGTANTALLPKERRRN